MAALAAGQVCRSPYGRTICQWTGQAAGEVPGRVRRAAGRGRGRRAGAGGPGRRCSREMYERARGDLPDEDPDRDVRRPRRAAGDHVRQAQGCCNGDLTPECAAVVAARCWTRCPPRPGRTMTGRRSSGTTTRWPRRCGGWSRPDLLPERAGQPVKVWAHISLAGPAAAGRRARPCRSSGPRRSGRGGPRTARAASEDRRRRRRLAGRRRRRGDRLRRGDGPDRDRRRQRRRAGGPGPAVRGTGRAGGGTARGTRPGPRSSKPSSARPWTCCPGPAGWRSFLRRRQLGARLAGPSLPLDIGYAETIPAGIRNAVHPAGPALPVVSRLRPARRRLAEVHHTKHKANGGKTSPSRTASCCAGSTTRS